MKKLYLVNSNSNNPRFSSFEPNFNNPNPVEEQMIRSEISKAFTNPETYLNPSSNIFLSSKPLKIKQSNKIIENSKSCATSDFERPKHYDSIHTLSKSIPLNILKHKLAPKDASEIKMIEEADSIKVGFEQKRFNQEAISHNHYEYCETKRNIKTKLLNLSLEKRNLASKDKFIEEAFDEHKISEDSFSNKKWLKEHVRSEMKKQGNRLQSANKMQMSQNEISKRIYTQMGRLPEDQLINNIDSTRIKNEINNLLELKHRKDERYGNFLWYVSLRDDPKSTKSTVRPVFVGVDKLNWAKIKVAGSSNLETIRRPQTGKSNFSQQSKDLKKVVSIFSKNAYFKEENLNSKLINLDAMVKEDNAFCLNGSNLKKVEDLIFDKDDFKKYMEYQKEEIPTRPTRSNLEKTIKNN